MSRILAVDLGDVRIGLAISDQSQTLASSYGYLQFKGYDDLVEKILSIARDEDVSEFVIGLPLNMDGSKGVQAGKAEKLAGLLRSKTQHPVNLVDERLSTVEATRQLHASGKKVRRGLVSQKEQLDKIAATIILQVFLDGKKSK